MTAFNDLLAAWVSSPWVYLAIFSMVFLDAIVPLFPSETIVIAATVVSLDRGQPSLLLVILTAAVAAFAGDQGAYGLGRHLEHRRLWARRPDGTWRRSVDWAKQQVRDKPWQLILSGRFIPGGRTVTSMVCGSVRYPRAQFSAASAVGSVLWAMSCAALGGLGGAAFKDNPALAVAVGVGTALSLTAIVEVVRAGRRRRLLMATPPTGERSSDQEHERLVTSARSV